MRLQVNDYGFDSQLPENEEESIIENSEKMFSILSDAIYKNKILAVIRELSCNARDAMYDAGKRNLPFRLKLPTMMEQTFRVEDDGIGIHPSQMRNVYLTYGRSSKTEDDNAIGALGLGSKSPLGYTKSSFIVKNRWHSAPSNDPAAKPITEYTYFIFINKRGTPSITLVGAEPTDQERGITVEFAVKTEDTESFIDNADRFFRYWKDVMPEFVDHDIDEVLTTKIVKVVDGGYWYLEDRDKDADFKGAYAIMGNVPYPILVDSIPNLPEELKLIAKNSFVIDFPLGTLAFAPSREDLSYDEFTVKNLIERLSKVHKELAGKFKEQIFAPGQTMVEFRQNFYDSLTKFGKVIRQETRNHRLDQNDNAWMCRFIFGTTDKGHVTYNGVEFSIADLFNRAVKANDDRRLPFNILTKEIRGRSNRVYIRSCTDLVVTALEAMPTEAVFGKKESAHYRGRTIDAGKNWNFDWQSTAFLTRKDDNDYNPLQRIFLNAGKFTIKTENTLYLHSRKVTFIINDDGGQGEAKFKAMVEAGDYDGEVFFIRHHPKEIDLPSLCKEVTAFIARNALEGSKVVFSSNLEDHREPIVRVKPDAGTTKLHYYEFAHNFQSAKKTFDVYMNRKYSTTVIQKLDYKGHQLRVFNLSDLINAPKPWLYVLKNRSKKDLFDPTVSGNSEIRSLLLKDDEHYLDMAMDRGFFTDVMHEEIDIPANSLGLKTRKYMTLVLNEGQVNWLKKKGVNLVSIRQHIHNKMKVERANHDFIKDIEDEAVMENISFVGEFYHTMSESMVYNVTNSPEGLFRTLLKDFFEYQKQKGAKLDSYMLMSLYRGFVDSTAKPIVSRAYDINAKLKSTYPILKMVSFKDLKSDDLTHLLEYIEISDRKVVAP